jgi:hypothetical protein
MLIAVTPIMQMMTMNSRTSTIIALFIGAAFLGACTHKVQVEAPKEPITINLNVKIEHEIRVKVEKDLDQVLSKDSGLF